VNEIRAENSPTTIAANAATTNAISGKNYIGKGFSDSANKEKICGT